MPRLGRGLRRAQQLKAIFSRLRKPGGLKEFGGLRATITRLKALKHRSGKMIHERSTRPPKTFANQSPWIWYTEPKSGTTGLMYGSEYSRREVRTRIAGIRKRLRQGKKST